MCSLTPPTELVPIGDIHTSLKWGNYLLVFLSRDYNLTKGKGIYSLYISSNQSGDQ